MGSDTQPNKVITRKESYSFLFNNSFELRYKNHQQNTSKPNPATYTMTKYSKHGRLLQYSKIKQCKTKKQTNKKSAI